MKVLLIGGSGSLMNKLIIKLKKEGHKIYLLTGQKYKKNFYEKVFERYDFSYDGETLGEIFKSVKPDVTIYVGAYDTNFDWNDEQKESVRYLASMTNILMSYAMVGSGRFVYLSSDKVYEGNYENPVTEEMEMISSDFMCTTLKQAEELCSSYRNSRKLDILTLRLDRFCSIPDNRKSIDNICAKMCMQALEKGVISYDENVSFSWIYDSDAIEYIHRIIVKEELAHECYHISDSEEMTEKEMAEMVREAMSENLDAEIAFEEQAHRKEALILSNERYANEIGVNFFCNKTDVVKKIVAHMVKNKELFLSGEEKEKTFLQKMVDKTGWFVKAMIPFVENLICFIPFFMLNNRAVGSEYFSRIDFYLLYVLLFALVYGQHQATFSAILAVCGYVFRQSYTRTSLEVLLDYNTYVWVAQLFIVGLVVGYMRDKYHQLKSEGKEEKLFLSEKVSDIQDINDSNVRVKDSLETQIVNQSDSIGKIYDITAGLDQQMPEKVLFYAAEILTKMMDSKEIAIYVMANADYGRLFTATSDGARRLGNSLKVTDLGEMYETLAEGKVYINRKLDDRYPLMANAVFDGDKMQFVVMVWGLSWQAMTLGTANVLAVTSSLIQNSILRANRYLNVLEEKRYQSVTGALEEEEFEKILCVYQEAKEKSLTEFTVLNVKCTEVDKSVVNNLYRSLRKTDYVGMSKDGGLDILLPNTKEENAQIVVERIQAFEYECQIVEDIKDV